MHPAPSVILFTVLSGLGFGLLFWLGLSVPAVTGATAAAMLILALGLATVGLVCSTFHLGNPQRALLAFTQWRSSWLSREGWLAVITLAAGTGFGALRVLDAGGAALGVVTSVGALATLGATAMIYTQLRSVPRWNQPATPVLLLLTALAGGAILSGQSWSAALLLLALGAVQQWVWRTGDAAWRDRDSTLGTATGLGDRGAVRAFEAPHTGPNYLLREMVHVVGRRHALRLRWIALICGALIPAALLMLLPAGHVVSGLAAAVHLGGVLAGRWLFFAEAEHVVGLYYGRS